MIQETVVNSEQVKGEREGRMWTGAFMLFVGAIFLMSVSGITIGGHSPSLLLGLVAVFWIGAAAYRRYKEDGRLSRRVLSIAIFALLPISYMAAMALGYSISGLWPLGIIAVGVSLILLGGSR